MTQPILEKRFVRTSFGEIAFLETGQDDKPPVLFVHGIPTSSYLWRHPLRFLQNDFHCFAPDLMGLGDTDVDPDTTEFNMVAQAEMLLEFMSTLGHDTFSVVAHDQGGAAVQIIAARQPQRLNALVLTDVVCYDNWPVPVISRLQTLSRIPIINDLAIRTGFMEWLETRTGLSAFRRGVYRPERLSTESIHEYLRPLRSGHKARMRFRQFLLAGHPGFTQMAVSGLKQLEKPTLILWAGDDFYISPSWGRKLFEDIPGAESFELIPFCGHYWQEERPAEYSSRIGEFLNDVQRRLGDDNETADDTETGHDSETGEAGMLETVSAGD